MVCMGLVTQLCSVLSDPLDCGIPGSSVPMVFQARILDWVATSFCRRSTQHRGQILVSCVSCIAGTFFTHWTIREAPFNVYFFHSFMFILDLLFSSWNVWLIPLIFKQSYFKKIKIMIFSYLYCTQHIHLNFQYKWFMHVN